MTQTIAHFVFTPSGAGCLVQALRKAGRDDQVIACFDDMSFGPINPSDPSLRAEWVEKELGRAGWREVSTDSERVWDETRFPSNRKIAWLSRRSAMEYAGFLDWLWRLGDAPCEVVDLTDVTVSSQLGPPGPPRLAMTLGMLHPDTIRASGLWDLAEPLPPTTQTRYIDLWRQLRSENVPLRVLDGGELVSAPISFFDSALMSHVTESWQRVSRVVGQALVSGMDDRVTHVSDIVLSARIEALVESGLLEIRGESALDMHVSEVRRRKAR
jgi:Protein of unknown function/Domain of unknown function (DUF1835)